MKVKIGVKERNDSNEREGNVLLSSKEGIVWGKGSVRSCEGKKKVLDKTPFFF